VQLEVPADFFSGLHKFQQQSISRVHFISGKNCLPFSKAAMTTRMQHPGVHLGRNENFYTRQKFHATYLTFLPFTL
jgi:hypothetical protein